MANELRVQITRMVKLQQTEREIRKLHHVLSQVESRTATLDAQLQEFVTAVESGKQQVLDLTKSSRDLEADLKVNEGRIAKERGENQGGQDQQGVSVRPEGDRGPPHDRVQDRR